MTDNKSPPPPKRPIDRDERAEPLWPHRDQRDGDQPADRR